MKGVSGLAVILLLALAAGVATAKWPALQASQVLQQNGVVLFSRPLTVSDFTFTDENGAPITRQDLMGKKVLMFFGYTFCPDICPTTLMDLRRKDSRYVKLEHPNMSKRPTKHWLKPSQKSKNKI